MEKIKLGLIEDIEAIRKAQELYLNAQAEFEVILSSASVESFLEGLDQLSVFPEIIISDIGLPNMSGIEGVSAIKRKHPSIEFVMISVFTDTDNIYKALCAGAVGYLVKDTPLSEVKEAILTIRKGGSPMTPSIARKVIAHFAPTKVQKDEDLTAKEQQIVSCIVEGMSYKLIADRLSISINTVRHHIRHIYKKLQVNSKAEVISISLRNDN